MSPRIIHIPLSGDDRKAQAKGIRHAHGLHASLFKDSVLIRGAAEAKIRKADRLECEAWNAIMWAGGPAMPSPGDPQEPTIGKAVNGGYVLLEAKCNRCERVSLVALKTLKHPPETPVWKLKAALNCEPCSEGAALQQAPVRSHPWPDLCAAGSRAGRADSAQTMKRDFLRDQGELPLLKLHPTGLSTIERMR